MKKPSDLTSLLGSKTLREAAEIICKENKLLHVDVDFYKRKYEDIKIKYDILLMSVGDNKPPVVRSKTDS